MPAGRWWFHPIETIDRLSFGRGEAKRPRSVDRGGAVIVGYPQLQVQEHDPTSFTLSSQLPHPVHAQLQMQVSAPHEAPLVAQ
ncbi:MAG TPA: hypothetical protein VFH27_01200 [Longimicrobiaceae bacterium]|nr:hypothetical protein [Longimicrobiaceae bacterium]